MKNPIPIARWTLRWELRRLRRMIERMRRREGSLCFYAEHRGPFARAAEALAAALQCILSDHLVPAADALEQGPANRALLPELEESEDAEVEPR